MKHLCKLFILSIVIFLCSSGLYAQVFRGGIQAGLTASEVSGDDAGGPDKLGWFASVFTNMDTGPYSRIQLELMYIQKGSRVYYDPWDEEHGGNNLKEDPEEPDHDVYRDYGLYLHYVEVPLVFRFDFSPLTRLPYVEMLTGELGISGSRVVGHYEYDKGDLDISERMAEERPFRSAELNLIAGLSYPVTDGLRFNVRLTQGVTPMRTRYSKDEIVCTHALECYRKRHQFNTVWNFGISYTFLAWD